MSTKAKWTKQNIMKLRLSLNMNHFLFAKKLGVSELPAQGWELGNPFLYYDLSKLDALEGEVPAI